MVNAHVLTQLNNNNFYFSSVKVRSLLSTMALFTSTDIYLPTTVIDAITLSNRYQFFLNQFFLYKFMVQIRRLQSYSFYRTVQHSFRLAPLMLSICLVIVTVIVAVPHIHVHYFSAFKVLLFLLHICIMAAHPSIALSHINGCILLYIKETIGKKIADG